MSLLPSDHQERAPLAGEVVAFAGRLSSLRRKEARALVARLGGRAVDGVTPDTTVLVVGAPEAGRQAAYEAIGGGRPRMLTEDQFRALAGLPSPSELDQQYYRVRDVLAMYPGVRDEHLRDLQKCKLVRAAGGAGADRFFSFSDLLLIRQVHTELQRGIPFRAVLRSMLASREGQLALDFRMDAQPAKVIALRHAPAAVQARARGVGPGHVAVEPSSDNALLAEQYFALASSLDDGSPANQGRAAAAYRKALEIDSRLVPALINLANLHYACDELIEAEALYERAAALEPDVFEAHFNLGNIHHDLGRYDEADAAYHQALALNPTYAEAHLYLAVALEKAGRSEDARPHWRAYQNLAPNGEWVELAREFSE